MNCLPATTAAQPDTITLLTALPGDVRADVSAWITALQSITPPITRALAAAARNMGCSYETARRNYYRWKASGYQWTALVNRTRVREKRPTLSPDLIEHWRGLCASNQRKSRPAYRALCRAFLAGRDIPGVDTGVPRDRLPRGWSYSNFMRLAPTKFELTAARIGRTAADNCRPLIFTTRRNLYVGSHYLFDDLWHDNFVNHLDLRQAGRPLEFHALDLFSACKFAWGMKVRTERDDGKMDGLKGVAMRYLLAYALGCYGYHAERGTIAVVEHGTAAIENNLEKMLFDLTGGKITVNRSGMKGDPAVIGQYGGRAKGNFRFKAALESIGGLDHNEFAFLPGQTGKDVEHRPEGTHGLLKYNDALLDALAVLPPERAALLQFPLIEFKQYTGISAEIYDRINARTNHQLEGWDDLCVPDLSPSQLMDLSAGLQPQGMRMRRLSPKEVWNHGRRGLTPLPPAAVALILSADLGQEVTVRNHLITIQDKTVALDPMRFLAADLRDQEKYNAVVNPFAPDHAYVFGPRGEYITALPRWQSVDRADTEALHRACGAAAKVEAQLLQPVRARAAAITRARLALHRHNAQVISGAPITPDEKQTAQHLTQLQRTHGTAAAAIITQPDPSDAADITHPEPFDLLAAMATPSE